MRLTAKQAVTHGFRRWADGAALLLGGADGRRRARRLLGLHLLRGDADSVTFQRDGVVWTILVNDRIISSTLFQTGGFQRQQLQGLVRWLEANGRGPAHRNLLVDIGANIGTTAIPFAIETGSRVLALEPDPINFELLRVNVAANHLESQITCLRLAVSDHPGRIEMLRNPTSAGSTEVLEPGPAPRHGDVVEAEARRLDDILREQKITFDQIAVVWSDTEGFERQVIDAGGRLWMSGIPLYVEVWPPGLARHGGMADFARRVNEYFETMVVAEDLQDLGSRPVERPTANLAQFMKTQRPSGTDVLLLPKRSSR